MLFENIGTNKISQHTNETVEGVLIHLFDSFSFIIQAAVPDEVFAAEVGVGHFVEDVFRV